jgi:hypothetical protein
VTQYKVLGCPLLGERKIIAPFTHHWRWDDITWWVLFLILRECITLNVLSDPFIYQISSSEWGPRNESDYSFPELQSNVLCHLGFMTQNIYDAWNLYGNQRPPWGLWQASRGESQCRALRLRSRALLPSFRSGSWITVGPERSEHLAMTRYVVTWPDLPSHYEWGAVWHGNSRV